METAYECWWSVPASPDSRPLAHCAGGAPRSRSSTGSRHPPSKAPGSFSPGARCVPSTASGWETRWRAAPWASIGNEPSTTGAARFSRSRPVICGTVSRRAWRYRGRTCTRCSWRVSVRSRCAGGRAPKRWRSTMPASTSPWLGRRPRTTSCWARTGSTPRSGSWSSDAAVSGSSASTRDALSSRTTSSQRPGRCVSGPDRRSSRSRSGSTRSTAMSMVRSTVLGPCASCWLAMPIRCRPCSTRGNRSTPRPPCRRARSRRSCSTPGRGTRCS